MFEQIIALDLGDARIGVAKCDPMGIVIRPLKTISTNELMTELEKLYEEFSIPLIVIGLPKNMDGSEGERALKARSVAKQIQNKLDSLAQNTELVFEDERLSSKEAEDKIRAEGIKINQSNKGLIDAYAAAVILEQYMSKL